MATFDPTSQIAIRNGGVITAPLFETPYTVPADFGGADVFFDDNSAEPIIQLFNGTSHIAMLPQPQDYGLNVYSGKDAPHYVAYHGAESSIVSIKEDPNNDYPLNLASVNFDVGTLYNVGWRAGITFHNNPAGCRTTFLTGGTTDKTALDFPANYPQDLTGPTANGWPLFNANVVGAHNLDDRYGDVQVTGPLPNVLHTLRVQGIGDAVIPAMSVYVQHKGISPKLAAIVSDYGGAASGIHTELGAYFDSRGALATYGNRQSYAIYCAAWPSSDYSLWLNGSSQYLNVRGLMVASNAERGPSFMPYERTPACPNIGMYLLACDPSDPDIAIAALPLGQGVPGVTEILRGGSPAGGPDTSAPFSYPFEMVVTDDDDMQAMWKTSVAFQNGRLHTVIMPVSMFPGQAYTPMVLDPALGVYYPVRFIPKTTKAVQAIASGGYLNRWSFKYSAGGYFMLINNDTGIQGQLFHTQAMSLDYNPTHLTPTTVSLPCFNPCVPNLVMTET